MPSAWAFMLLQKSQDPKPFLGGHASDRWPPVPMTACALPGQGSHACTGEAWQYHLEYRRLTFHRQADEKDKNQTVTSFSTVIGIQRLFQIKYIQSAFWPGSLGSCDHHMWPFPKCSGQHDASGYKRQRDHTQQAPGCRGQGVLSSSEFLKVPHSVLQKIRAEGKTREVKIQLGEEKNPLQVNFRFQLNEVSVPSGHSLL